MAEATPGRPLPAEVRQRLVAIASDLMGKRPVAELPPSIRRFARFAPPKRLRIGAAEIATALELDDGFRESVAEVVSEASPELVEQVRAGNPPSTADPVDVGVIGYLVRPPGWQELLIDISDRIAKQRFQHGAGAEQERTRAEMSRLRETNLELVRERDSARAALKAAVAEHAERVEQVQRELRRVQGELRSARRAAEEAERALSQLRTEQARNASAESGELRKARSRIATLEADLEAGRRSSKLDREHDEVRLWLLLETIGAAALGLRRELDLSSPSVRPADSVADTGAAAGGRPSTIDASLLDRLLDGPHVHLIVDGYNLTKTGYPALPLVGQRSRLVSSLGALAARTGVEVSVAFDGTAAPTGAAASLPTPRGVRVLFSATGQLADDLIRDLLHAEPAGRTVVVASSDEAVAASVRAGGGWPVPATVLLSRLERG